MSFRSTDVRRCATLLIAGASLLAGCTAMPVSSSPRPDTYYSSVDTEQALDSLFATDAATLSDDAIQRILAYRYQPPPMSRIALMSFGSDAWSGWSEELALATEKTETEVLEALRASPSVYDASYLPSILVPQTRTVPHLREAAARYQADLLLVYRSNCRTFQKFRFFSADKWRAYCGVEAVLLDTRTGLVPFTTVATRLIDVTKNRSDTNFRETQLRAQLNATASALGDVSVEIVRFLAAAGN